MSASGPRPAGPGDGPEPVPAGPLADVPGRYVRLPSGDLVFLADSPPPPAPPHRNGTSATAAAVASPVATDTAAAPPSRLGARMDEAPPARPRAPWAAPEEPRADGLQEIIDVVPGALSRWGITAIAAAVGVMLVLAAVVRFPMVVTGTGMVTTPDAPVRLATSTGGEIARVLVGDGQAAGAGEVLLALKSAADYRAVLRLQEALAAAAPGALPAPALPPAARAALGEVTQPLAAYDAARASLAAFEADPTFGATLASLRAQLERQRTLLGSSDGRIDLLRQDVALAERDLGRSRELVSRQLLSPAEGERAEAVLLSKRQALENGRNEVLGQQMRSGELQREVLDAEQQHAEEGRRLGQDARKALSAVQEALAQWEARYLLRAPLPGRVSFFRRLAEGQYLAPGEAVVAVVPGSGRPVATVRIPVEGMGRVRAGQRVVFRFSAYPYQEYGTVDGTVRSVSLVASDPGAAGDARPEYLASVALPHGLRTSEGSTLPLRQEMSASAEIITEDRTVLQRFMARMADRTRGTPR